MRVVNLRLSLLDTRLRGYDGVSGGLGLLVVLLVV